jgi:hypothetical protein
MLRVHSELFDSAFTNTRRPKGHSALFTYGRQWRGYTTSVFRTASKPDHGLLGPSQARVRVRVPAGPSVPCVPSLWFVSGVGAGPGRRDGVWRSFDLVSAANEGPIQGNPRQPFLIGPRFLAYWRGITCKRRAGFRCQVRNPVTKCDCTRTNALGVEVLRLSASCGRRRQFSAEKWCAGLAGCGTLRRVSG